MRIILSLLAGMLAQAVFAQSGNFYLYNYTVNLANTEAQNQAILQDSLGQMFFANTRGVMMYDGSQWALIHTKSTPYSLALGPQGLVMVGCQNHFGYLKRDIFGQYSYQIIAQPENQAPIRQIFTIDNWVYFYSEKTLFQVNPENFQIKQEWKAPENQPFGGIFALKGQLYLLVAQKGWHRVKSSRLEFFPSQAEWQEALLLAAMPLNDDRILLGLDDNSLWEFDGQNFKSYALSNAAYLTDNLLTGGIDFSEKYFVLATLSGGCIVVEKANGHIHQTINSQTGLPDNEIISLARDQHGGLWIGHAKGVSRADLALPIRNFSNYPGLRGNINAVLKTDSTLYVATGEGVFYLAKVDKMEQLVTLIKQEQREVQVVERNIQTTLQVLSNPFQSEPKEGPSESLDKDESLSKKEKRRLERQKRRDERRNPNIAAEETPASPQTQRPDTLQVKETTTVAAPIKTQTTTQIVRQPSEPDPAPSNPLIDIPFLYNPIEGIKVKALQLLPFQETILVATAQGLYEIQNLRQARLVQGGIYVYSLAISERFPNVIYLATNQGVKALRKDTDRNWLTFLEIQDLQEPIYAVAEKEARLWLAGSNHAFAVEIDPQGQVGQKRVYDFPNNYAETPLICTYQNQLIFALSTGFYQPDEDRKKLELATSQQVFFNPQTGIVYRQPGFFWTRPPGKAWRNLNGGSEGLEESARFLAFFGQIRDIYVDKQNNFWVVADEKIYRIQNEAYVARETFFRAEIRGAFLRGQRMPMGGMILPANARALRFELSATHYLKENDWEFQYRLEGLDKEWSEWNKNRDLPFPTLPGGKYRLRVKARNIFGQESAETVLEFRIRKSFLETPWAYVLFLLLMAFVTFGIIRWRTYRLAQANARLEKRVAEKTEALQTQQSELESAFEEISSQKEQIQQQNLQLQQSNAELEVKVEERTAKLKSTLLQLLQTNKELDTFIYRASHDLRGPISRLIGLVQLIRIDPDKQAIQNHLRLLEFTAQKMDNMLEKLTNIHVIHSDPLQYEKVCLRDFLEEIRKSLSFLPSFKDVYLIIPPNYPEFVFTDRILLGIILQNLLENSIHYRDPSPDVFSVIKLEMKADDNFIELKITDNGIGISPEVKERVFDMFFRGTERSQGNGLGLYLVKKATEKLNGRIYFRSDEKNLTSFSVILPHAQAREKPVLENAMA
ncbi:MAG: hypothetical protein HC913_19935 [Microscillaceae bacterium]|nr:hypothetical protein [Microscillaceae bacterium]